MEDKKEEIIEEFKREIGCGTFKGKPNYTKLKPISQLLDAMELASPHSALILDFYKHNIHYISPSSLLLCGYDPQNGAHLPALQDRFPAAPHCR